MSDTREALIDAAHDLLDEGGVAAVTLREVGRRAGVSHNAPYKHFVDKNDLLAAVVARDLRRRTARGRDRQTPTAAVDHVRAMIQGSVRHALAHPHLFKLTYGPWHVESEELTAAADAARAELVTAVAAAQHQRALPAGNPERVAALLLAVAHGAADLALSGHLAEDGKGQASPAALVDDLFAHMVDAR